MYACIYICVCMHRHYIFLVSVLQTLQFNAVCLEENFPSQIDTLEYFPILFAFSGGQIILSI